MAAASASQAASAAAERAKEAREVATAKAKELGEVAEGALGKAPTGPSMGTVVIAAPPGPERDALVRLPTNPEFPHLNVSAAAAAALMMLKV